ncbi:hypothetical protein B9T31_09460 [Acinetobacter sp. ANC 4558]|uniref:tape measure protein n=1 Tax=Acinetobacter sp. ANC 4558 TaxID=1977876 RepID=UPI000A34B868|nr:tape measure protein [Acinetobacter sp. ANC 4558]OTG85813.1 hypothetical protein B9T31_09460 [Acinetobacter sp. ANC 4558]
MSAKLGTLTLDMIAKISNFVGPMKSAGDTAQRESKRIESSVNSATKAILSFGAATIAGLTVGEIVKTADAYTQNAARIRNATKDAANSTEEYDYVQQRLLKTANSTYRALGEAQEVYLGVSGGLKELGYDTKQVLDISDSLSFSFVHNATSADKAQSAMSAYGKVLDKNKVEANSWFSIIAAVPNVLDDVAKATGKSTQEVRKLGAEGKLAAADLHKGFLLSKDANKELADAMENSLADGMFAVKNGFSVLVGEVNIATGATNKLAAGLAVAGDTMVWASQNLDVLTVVGGTAVAFMAGTYIPIVIKGTQATVADTISKITNIAAQRSKAIADYDVAKSNLAATAAMVRSMGVTNAQTAAMISNARAAYQQAAAAKTAALASASITSVLGGPVGLGLTVAGVAASYLLFRDNTKHSTVSLRENNTTVEDAIKKYKELGELERKGQIVEERETLDELTRSYEQVNQELVSHSLKMSRSTDMSTAQASEFNKLVQQYKSGKITLEQLSVEVHRNTNFTQKQKDEFDKQAKGLEQASKKMSEQKSLITEIQRENTKLTKSHNDVANAVNRQKNAYEGLTDQQKKVYDSASQRLQRQEYIEKNVSQGTMTRPQAEHFADKRIEAGIPFNQQLSKIMYEQINAVYKLNLKEEARLETEKKTTEEKKKQLDLAEKTVKSQTIDAVIARGEGNYNSFNRGKAGDSLGQKINLTGMTVGQIRQMQDSGKIFAAGKYQNIPSTLQGAVDSGIVSVTETFNAEVQEKIFRQYLVTSKSGRKSLEDYLTGKSDDVVAANIDLAKVFASVAHPATGKSYYDGKGNNKASISAKEAQEALMASRSLYAMAIAAGKSADEAWRSSFDSSLTFVKDSDTQKALEVVLDKQNEADTALEKSLEYQKTIKQRYYTEEEVMAAANADAIKDIEKAFLGDKTAITKYLLLQEVVYQKDVEAFKDAQRQKELAIIQYDLSYASKMESVQDNIALMSAPKNQRARLGLVIDERNAHKQNDEQLFNDITAIDRQKIELGIQEHHKRLEDAKRLHKENEYAISLEYKEKEADLLMQQKAEQLDLWGSVLSQGQNTFAQLTQSVQNSAGEQSGIYRTMFAMQKAFTIASSTMAAYNAYTTAFADPSAMTLAQKFAGGAAVMAALMPAITTISSLSLSGMAHDGIDNVPSEGTWLLDKGERVVDSRTNSDLKKYLAGQKQQAPQININNHVGAEVNTRQNPDGSINIDVIEKQLANRLASPNSVISKSLKNNTNTSRRR